MTSEVSDRLRRFSLPAYFILALAVIDPLVQLLLSVFPFRFGNVMWRYGTTGLASGAIASLLTGLLFISILAFLLGDRKVVLTVAVIAAVTAVIAILGSGTLALDALQMKGRVRPEAVRGFTSASAQAVVKLALEAIGSTLLSIAAFRAGRGARSAKVRTPRETLLVGVDAT